MNFKNSPDLPNPRVFPKQDIVYHLLAYDTNGCSARDSVKIKVINRPEIKHADTVICIDEVITLNAGNPGCRYQWNTGATSQLITVPPGKYSAIVSNTCFTDTIRFTIEGKDCQLQVYIPNGFSPNSDGLNDIFAVSGDNVSHVNLLVFNRWGECVFKGDGPSPAWDGTYNGLLCPINPYIYIAEVTGSNGGKRTLRGVINLVR